MAERRAAGLLAQRAALAVVAPSVTEGLRALADEGRIAWYEAEFAPEHLTGALLVIAATDVRNVNAAVGAAARERGVLVCRADAPGEGDFTTPAVIERGDLLIALTTGGASPTLAAVLRARLDDEFGPEWAQWTELLAALRPALQQLAGGETERRRAVERVLSEPAVRDLIARGDVAGARREAERRCI